MLAIPPCGASSNIALWRAKIKPPVELVVGDLENYATALSVTRNWASREFVPAQYMLCMKARRLRERHGY